jgi:hypothetical protein
MPHPHVINPLTLRLLARQARPGVLKAIDGLLVFMTKVLGSRWLFLIALILPLLSLLPAFDWTQKFVLIISSTWIQWWALHALQRSQNQGDALREAKAQTDHDALTHIATQVDSLMGREVPR